MKVGIWDKQVWQKYSNIIGIISSIITLVLIFYDIPHAVQGKVIYACAFLLFLVLIFLVILFCANQTKKASLKVNGVLVCVKQGDIFEDNGNLKVIPFTERFDTQVDDIIISKNSLNGIYISRFFSGREKELSAHIKCDSRLQTNLISVEANDDSKSIMRYKLGTIHREGDYLLLAFAKMNKNNEAYLDNNSLWDCLMNMWQEIGMLYAGKSIDIPLLGSGITRLTEANISEQELLELILHSLRISGISLNWNVGINFIIYKENTQNINFYRLKDCSDYRT